MRKGTGMRSEAKSVVLVMALIAGLGVSLTACDGAEQGRVLRYEKGTYLGQKDTKLSSETESMLRARAAMQRGI
jgi:hypothetical protein